MWGQGRRAALFIVSYTPLAAMFLALRWPKGWPAADLGRLALGVLAIAVLFVALFGLAFASGRAFHRVLGAIAILGAVIVAIAIIESWTEPLVLHPVKQRTSAAGAAVALAFMFAGIGLLLVILRNAARGTSAAWTVTDPHDQGAAVAGYLASYLLPLLNPDAHGVRTAVAYAIYLGTLFIVFMRSAGLVTINPMIYLAGYRIFDVQLVPPEPGEPRRILMLSKDQLKSNTEVEAVSLGDDCYVAVRAARP